MTSLFGKYCRRTVAYYRLAKLANVAEPLHINKVVNVPDRRSRILEVVLVGRIFNLGTGNLEWGGNGKGLRKGRSVCE